MRIVVTAGPTREHLDPVRFLSNPSTGKMGFAIARVAQRRGHRVTLIAGPVTQPTPKGVERVDVTSAREMLAAVEKAVGAVDESEPVVLISSAAIADWRPAKRAMRKLKKGTMDNALKLVRNPDILKTIAGAERRRIRAGSLMLVGFAAETNDVLREAVRKCREKSLAFIVANDVSEPGSGFGTDTNRVTFVHPDGSFTAFPLATKQRVAARILVHCETLIGLGKATR